MKGCATMRRKYWANWYHNFGWNVELYYTESAEMEASLPEGVDRITRKEAEKLARENYLGYADVILPADVDYRRLDGYHYILVGRIWEKGPYYQKKRAAK